ncbi:MAG: DUF1592 domain-containing protein [Proteobacteria bacterium]|nr:DUF1592 domain-containing protein [Pseudomonadota bacterium]
MRRSGLITSVVLLGLLAMGAFFLVSTQTPELASTAPGAVAVPLASTGKPGDHSTLVNQYCVACHNQTLLTGGLALDSIDVTTVSDHPQVWEQVLKKLRANAMPPTGMPRPDAATFQQFTAYLESSLDNLALQNPNPGRTATFNRLNRLQYQNAIRDLLAVEVDVSELLPKDDASYGFDNVNLTNLSPTLMERYLAAAQKISRLAVGTPLHNPASHVELVAASLTQEDRLEGLPFGTRGGTSFAYHFPRDGEYRLDVVLARDRNENIEGLTEAHEMEMTIDGERVGLFEIVPNRTERFATFYYSDQGAGDGLTASASVTAGPHAVAVTFIKKNSALLESTRQPYIAHFNRDRHPRQQPAVHSVSIGGPFESTGISGTPSRDRIFNCRPGESVSASECARSIVAPLAQTAFRRPITDDDIATPLAFFERVNNEEGFEAGIEMAIRALLVSPQFLFRIEQDPADFAAGQVYALSDVDLASRLSFFLWSSIPDAELLDLAIQEQLSDPEVLAAQVQRMLADPKAEALASNFASQWLYLRNLDGVDPNTRLFPDFDDNLRQAMRQETELLFKTIIAEDRDVMELLSADYTFLNERLARHYDIPNVYGDHFRKVSLPQDSPRLGLLGHGSVLTVTSYATRTSPVQRGKWVLENVLGIPPPPPPDNVPALAEDHSEVKIETMRDRMAQHRANPACAACHQVMDPIGLVMEDFDAIGRWREPNTDHPSIDTTGNLPGGDPLAGVNGLRSALLDNPAAFVGTMSEKLLTYALGRGLEYYDGPAIRKILNQATEQDYRFSSLVLGIVNSTPFQMRRTQ